MSRATLTGEGKLAVNTGPGCDYVPGSYPFMVGYHREPGEEGL